MKHLKDDFKDGMPISSVGAGWFNGVAKFINNLTGGYAIKMNKDGDYPTVDFDTTQDLGYAATVPNQKLQQGGQGDDDAAIAARHPKDILTIPANETPEQKQTREIADLGTSEFAARADHQHRLPNDTSTPSELEEPEDLVTSESSFFYLFEDSWDKGVYTDGDGVQTQNVGIKFHVCTGGKRRADNAKIALKFREITIDRYGRVISVGQEVGGYHIEDT